MDPKTRILKRLEKQDFITLTEALAMGLNKMALSRMVAAGTLHRPARQIYCVQFDWLTHPLRRYAPACTLYPDAVICGVSALVYYDLTDEIERKIWLAFPQQHRVVNREYRMLYPSGSAYSLGIEHHRVGQRHVRIYDSEKSVVDAFKYLPVDIAHKALRGYLKQKDRDIGKLTAYAKKLRKPLDHAITLLLSDA